mmetsp:Transcript_71763/g.126685  ORF Transcript_71763/g.126685 Transcript_71763/m.126685 type:complete len:134 (+) Transcript_71763:70-471(+)|eukprot:CAMPEP_0197658554 /NCGR_PEP_ID=MMETSP1338-20131121/45306_1 /TAXON_ID=43686 ORGANISM="Pelagodinium beii, Strain RCC1491" /NCGR_SAMPLE_ID=MMETSP1338 /ASSEMBLY_ACC=CAM_ASM_000754 /LENGTH=133 /DNA_ID=CAMNT_0043235161 /DNA_START=70 /DNA_END=471 /DNA_ORIENTATION=+
MANAWIAMQVHLHDEELKSHSYESYTWSHKVRVVRQQQYPVIKHNMKFLKVRYPNKMKTTSGEIYVLKDTLLDRESGMVNETWVHFQDGQKQRTIDNMYDQEEEERHHKDSCDFLRSLVYPGSGKQDVLQTPK